MAKNTSKILRWMNYIFARLSNVSLSNVCDMSFLQRNINTSFLKKITYFIVQLRSDDCMEKKYIPLNKSLQVIVLLHIKLCYYILLMQVLETSKVLFLWTFYSGDNSSYQVLYYCSGKTNLQHENSSILKSLLEIFNWVYTS